MFDIGGAESFRRHIHVYICLHMPVFYMCKAQQKFLKLKFVLEPKFFFAKMAQMWI